MSLKVNRKYKEIILYARIKVNCPFFSRIWKKDPGKSKKPAVSRSHRKISGREIWEKSVVSMVRMGPFPTGSVIPLLRLPFVKASREGGGGKGLFGSGSG